MQALCISDVYRQLNHYQSQYSHILQTPELFQQPILDAFCDVWPFGKKTLCLGELLILWQSQKWSISHQSENVWNTLFGTAKSSQQHYLLYQIEQSNLFAPARAKAYVVETGETIQVELTAAWRFAVYQVTSQHHAVSRRLQCA